jgi:hypothetical protein
MNPSGFSAALPAYFWKMPLVEGSRRSRGHGFARVVEDSLSMGSVAASGFPRCDRGFYSDLGVALTDQPSQRGAS